LAVVSFFAVGVVAPADPEEAVSMLVELGLVEQRYQAVLEVLRDGVPVAEVARRHGVARQTVHGEHPGWRSRTILFHLEREDVSPVPGRTSIERCLIRHGLIVSEARKRKRSDYIRWERSKAMELWQMDIVGGVKLADGSEAKIVSGIDDHSRFVISAYVVERATARPTCDALALAMRRFGVPEEVLTDGKVFTNRFGKGMGEVLFDRICRETGSSTG
jgi:hypothetical protein